MRLTSVSTPRERSTTPVMKAVVNKGVVEKLTRFGYVAHGLIYIIIGGLAAQFAIGEGGTLTDPPGALKTIRHQPLGKQAVLFTAIGLAAYALWRLIQAAADPDGQGTSAKGLAVRVGRVISAIGYAALAILAVRLFTGSADSNDSGPNSAAQVLTEPVGAMLGTMIALIIFGVAFEDVRKACTARFGERMKASEMTMIGTHLEPCHRPLGIGGPGQCPVLRRHVSSACQLVWKPGGGERLFRHPRQYS